MTPPTISRPAGQLAVGDRIAAGFLPDGEAATVLFLAPYTLRDRPWMFAVVRFDDAEPCPEYFLADAQIPLESVADPTGLNYTRADTDADDPTPVSPARVPLHTGSVVDGGALVTDTDGRE